ncbi:Uroporphyrinogen decarboxylase (URO-D) [Acetitomaculum ruminis DSM 5522]|uniref:Uroporphyrinogen decarboxylase (URO-D) n=1 Tax=Acetitomaculum ruminis DSM 5522 TaxID=1120918 RepID=A0A1I0UXL9_9FIRM|nr:uroporphyrinogen decarboxylase family protein [Acetitomaculum ruminis]SFA68839.1 Uroporphyrinogen decarboxylase (URO-D) [Acetitomaculum ruminis DSM 5522]
MLTPRENMMEVIKGGNPDRFVKQYEALEILLSSPYHLQYPIMPEKPGDDPVKCGWGYYNAWPAGTPGAFPMHDPEHLVCPDITKWREYVKAPDINYTEADWKTCQEEAAKVDRKEKFVAAFVAPGIFEMCHYLCEIQNTLINFYEEPEAMHELIEYITDWELKYAEQICKYMKPDAIFHHDDWGTQRSTFLSVDMFREFYLEPYKKVYNYYHEHGIELIIHHNDSYSATLVPSMIEMGIDVWQGCMSVNDLPSLVKEYGKDITFMGGIDNGIVDKADWSQEIIAKETDQLCRDCGKLYFIPCTSHGLSFSTFPEVYPAVDKEIDKMSKEMFG